MGQLKIMKKPAIEQLTSAVFDNGRRGAPLPGCDCVQCFGYCAVDREIAMRDNLLAHDKRRMAVAFGFDFKTLEAIE